MTGPPSRFFPIAKDPFLLPNSTAPLPKNRSLSRFSLTFPSNTQDRLSDFGRDLSLSRSPNNDPESHLDPSPAPTLILPPVLPSFVTPQSPPFTLQTSPNYSPRAPKIKNKTVSSSFGSRDHFPNFMICNAESLNFEKMIKLAITANITNSHLVAVTEVQAQHPDSLKASG